MTLKWNNDCGQQQRHQLTQSVRLTENMATIKYKVCGIWASETNSLFQGRQLGTSNEKTLDVCWEKTRSLRWSMIHCLHLGPVSESGLVGLVSESGGRWWNICLTWTCFLTFPQFTELWWCKMELGQKIWSVFHSLRHCQTECDVGSTRASVKILTCQYTISPVCWHNY